MRKTEQIRAELGNHWPALNNDSQEFLEQTGN